MHLMSWEREKKRKGLWGTICDDTARKGVQNPGGSAAADSSNSANTHTCKAKKERIVIVIPSSLPPGSTSFPTPTLVMSSLLYPPLVAYNDVHGYSGARVEHLFAHLWSQRVVRDIWLGSHQGHAFDRRTFRKAHGAAPQGLLGFWPWFAIPM